MFLDESKEGGKRVVKDVTFEKRNHAQDEQRLLDNVPVGLVDKSTAVKGGAVRAIDMEGEGNLSSSSDESDCSDEHVRYPKTGFQVIN